MPKASTPNRQKKEKTEKSEHHRGDKSFKVIMKVRESAIELIKELFPMLYSHIDINDFEIDETNYIDSDFSEFYSDVVYRTKFKEPIRVGKKEKVKDIAIVLLFEHKKTVESYFLLFIQLLEYILFIWKNDIANKRTPSVIVPIVLFQGKRGLSSKELHDCFEGIPKELLQFLPNFRFHLIHVHKLSDASLLNLDEQGVLRSLLLAYTYTERKNKIDNLLIEIFKFFQHSSEKLDFFKLIFEFLAKEDYLSSDKIEELIAQYESQSVKEDIMTTYQVWTNKGKEEGMQIGKEEGMQIGEQKGIQIGKREAARSTVLRGRHKGASVDFLSDVSELPYAEVVNLVKGYEQVYAKWSKKEVIKTVEHLTDTEVKYLVNLLNKNQN